MKPAVKRPLLSPLAIYFLILVAALCLLVSVATNAQNGGGVSSAKPEAAKPKIIKISADQIELVERYKNAVARREEARRLMEESAVWRGFKLAESQEQALLAYIIGEAGGKPSECTLFTIDKDGKPDVRLECKPAAKTAP